MFGGGSCGGDGWVNGCVCVVGLLVVLWRWFGGSGGKKVYSVVVVFEFASRIWFFVVVCLVNSGGLRVVLTGNRGKR